MKIFKSPLFWIFIVALFLRIYKLGELPYGFHVDEVKVAWNALSILKTGKDDKNQIVGLYYNSFGDYRPSGIFYFTIPSIAIFRRSEFSTRFPIPASLPKWTEIPICELWKPRIISLHTTIRSMKGILSELRCTIKSTTDCPSKNRLSITTIRDMDSPMAWISSLKEIFRLESQDGYHTVISIQKESGMIILN